MSAPEDVEALLAEHEYWTSERYEGGIHYVACCSCGWEGEDYRPHVATVLAAYVVEKQREAASDALLSARADLWKQSGIRWGREDWREWLRIRAENVRTATTYPTPKETP